MKFVTLAVLTAAVHSQAEELDIEGSYIVKLKEQPGLRSLTDSLAELRSMQDSEHKHPDDHQHYMSLGKVYCFKMSEENAAEMSLRDDVEYVEKDFVVEAEAVQEVAAWHLSRISHRNILPASQHKFIYNATGQGITVYIIDSGINTAHPEFEGRARHGKTFFGTGSRDGTGHGTFVAGLVGAKTFGVAKQANMVAVKIFDAVGRSSGSSTIAAIDWVVKNAAPGTSVLNLSIGATKSRALNEAVEAAIKASIVVVTAAGNENVDACTRSPASSPAVITVGSIGPTDIQSPFSNYGACVDVFAPGERLPSASNKGGVNLATGTSAAAPVVAGIVANYLSSKPNSTPAEIKSKLISSSTSNSIKNLRHGSHNRVVYNSD
ncbi:hypothetical protein DSO57_1002301 [Entomophthora muscae]|uniref:Uncharacterized protein n=1 Tax=Entomophthora muscae TaxID=34485 RepID=A0ACC2TK53_9FUNG|nr:hypothetical protein DSO57_1002301 [Entomophthora muscae]